MEKVVDLRILCKIRVNLSGKVMIKERLGGKVVILTEEVLVLRKEEVILFLEVVFMVIDSDVAKKGIDPSSVGTLGKMNKVIEIL
jgi:hypothetical protein